MNFISLPYSSFPLLPLPLPLRKAMSLPTRLLFVSSSKRCCCRSGQTLPAQALLSTFRQPRLAQIHHNLLIPSRPFSFKTIAENMSDSLSQTSVTLDSATTDQEDEEFDIQPHWKSMESRVVKRRLVPATEETRKRGVRGRVPPTEEDAWSQAGLYEADSTNNSTIAVTAGDTVANTDDTRC